MDGCSLADVWDWVALLGQLKRAERRARTTPGVLFFAVQQDSPGSFSLREFNLRAPEALVTARPARESLTADAVRAEIHRLRSSGHEVVIEPRAVWALGME
jgi:hypothetical protein